MSSSMMVREVPPHLLGWVGEGGGSRIQYSSTGWLIPPQLAVCRLHTRARAESSAAKGGGESSHSRFSGWLQPQLNTCRGTGGEGGEQMFS
jgi:hypothetical protein